MHSRANDVPGLARRQLSAPGSIREHALRIRLEGPLPADIISHRQGWEPDRHVIQHTERRAMLARTSKPSTSTYCIRILVKSLTASSMLQVRSHIHLWKQSWGQQMLSLRVLREHDAATLPVKRLPCQYHGAEVLFERIFA
jgi:hypothetical protein